MSLLKLLSAGKSLDGSKPTPSPYRMRTANLLPKFGSRKNPFEASPKSEPVKPEAKSAPAPMETKPLFEEASKPATAPVDTASAPSDVKPAATQKMSFEPKPTSAAPAAPATKAAKPGILSGLLKKLNPAAYLPKRQPGTRGARPKAARAAVQGELSLEKVRVLRNELNDSDLEIITAKPAATRTAGTMLPAMPQPRLTTWGRLTSRFAGVAETQIQ